MAHVGALGDDQAHARGGPAGVVRPYVLTGHAAGENIRVIGAIAMRLGTVRPFSVTGRDRISAAREAVDVVTVMRVLRG
ncbi:hypothetical protein GCM10020254_04180 [Streptomyces goshikiensis]